ncbi:uncharacterized protein V6R79_008445 [Siganus canaliculatus]
MADGNMSEFYAAVCKEHEIKTNPDILNALESAATMKDVTLDLNGSTRLRRLHRICDEDVLALSKCLRNNQCVTGLDLSFSDVSDAGAAHLAELLQQDGSALKSLDLRFSSIQADGAEVLARSLQGNSSLLCLRLSRNVLGTRGALQLASMLQVNRSLRELEVSACDLTIQSVIAFAIALKSNSTLRSLDVSRALLFSRQEWAVHLSLMLQVNSSLVELHLGRLGMSDTAVERLLEGLRSNQSLRYLDLQGNRVTRDGARLLALLLEQNRTLEILDLSFNRIEDAGAGCLSEAVVRPDCVLSGLSVCSNRIRTEGLLALTSALRASSALQQLYVWGNQLEEPVCQAFRELIASGRLPPDQTDVSAYEVDGHVLVAEVQNSLRRL